MPTVESTDIKESRRRAEKYDNALTAMSFHHDHWVWVVTDESASILIPSAILQEDPEGPFVWVFAEHHLFQIFAKDEIRHAMQLKADTVIYGETNIWP